MNVFLIRITIKVKKFFNISRVPSPPPSNFVSRGGVYTPH